MKSREISRSKIGPFSLACTDPYKGIGWEYQSIPEGSQIEPLYSRTGRTCRLYAASFTSCGQT